MGRQGRRCRRARQTSEEMMRVGRSGCRIVRDIVSCGPRSRVIGSVQRRCWTQATEATQTPWPRSRDATATIFVAGAALIRDRRCHVMADAAGADDAPLDISANDGLDELITAPAQRYGRADLVRLLAAAPAARRDRRPACCDRSLAVHRMGHVAPMSHVHCMTQPEPQQSLEHILTRPRTSEQLTL